LIFDEFEKLLSEKTKLVAITHVSNALGTINPIKKIIERAHRHGIPVLIDGAQAAAHLEVDVQDLDCEFYAFSGHKMYGPTGVGVLYGKAKLLEEMPPYQAGGDMISAVTFEKTLYNGIPYKFEAGTPDIAGVIGLGAAIVFIQSIGIENIRQHEEALLREATKTLSKIPKIQLIGTASKKAAVLNFVMEGVHPHDIGTIVDQEGVAIRTGHHCAMPVMQHFGVPATARASFGVYNTMEEIEALTKALQKVKEVFS
jgi:cysteine desulfurase/selenocysteine lyase